MLKRYLLLIICLSMNLDLYCQEAGLFDQLQETYLMLQYQSVEEAEKRLLNLREQCLAAPDSISRFYAGIYGLLRFYRSDSDAARPHLKQYLEWCDSTCSYGVEYPATSWALASCYMGEGSIDEAERRLRKAVVNAEEILFLVPNEASLIFSMLGSIYSERGDTVVTPLAYKKASEFDLSYLSKDDEDAYENLILLHDFYRNHEMHEKAVQAARIMEEGAREGFGCGNPFHMGMLTALLEDLESAGHFSESIIILDQQIPHFTRNTENWAIISVYYGWALYETGEYLKSIGVLKEVDAFYVSQEFDIEQYFKLNLCLLNASESVGNYQDAIAYVERLQRLVSEDEQEIQEMLVNRKKELTNLQNGQ